MVRGGRRAIGAVAAAAAFVGACGGGDAAEDPSWLQPCPAPIEPAVDAPSLTFTPPDLRPIRTSQPRPGLTTLVGQMPSTVAEQSAWVEDRAAELAMDVLFEENEGTDAEYTYSDGEQLYLVAMRQVCEGRIEVRLNEEPDPAAS